MVEVIHTKALRGEIDKVVVAEIVAGKWKALITAWQKCLADCD